MMQTNKRSFRKEKKLSRKLEADSRSDIEAEDAVAVASGKTVDDIRK